MGRCRRHTDVWVLNVLALLFVRFPIQCWIHSIWQPNISQIVVKCCVRRPTIPNIFAEWARASECVWLGLGWKINPWNGVGDAWMHFIVYTNPVNPSLADSAECATWTESLGISQSISVPKANGTYFRNSCEYHISQLLLRIILIYVTIKFSYKEIVVFVVFCVFFALY